MHPTTRGIVLFLVAAPLLGLSAWLPGMGWLAAAYLVFLAALFAIDYRASGKPERFHVQRRHEARLSLGAENPVTVSVLNPGRQAVHLWVRDEPPPAFRASSLILSGQAAPRQTWQAAYTVNPPRRGNYRFGDLHLRWRSPLGLLVRQARFPAEEPVKVYPNLVNIHRYDLLVKRNRLQEMGLRHSRMFGQGTDFERLREYLPDDDYRRIDWKATARRLRPVTVEYQTERSQTVVAVVDTGRMMQSPVGEIAKLDYVINAVLFFSYVATGKGDKVGLVTFADKVTTYLAPRQGRVQFYRMLELLYGVESQPVEPDYRKALSYLATRQRKRSLIVLFTDLSGETSMNSLLVQAPLLARRSLVLVVTISDPDVHQAAQAVPGDSQSAYQRAAAVQLLDERALVIQNLRKHGVLTIDVPANQLSTAVINRYLELKAKTML